MAIQIQKNLSKIIMRVALRIYEMSAEIIDLASLVQSRRPEEDQEWVELLHQFLKFYDAANDNRRQECI